MKTCFTFMVRLFGLLSLLWILPLGAKAQCSLSVLSQNNPLCASSNSGGITVSMANGLNYQLMPGNMNVSNGVFNNLIAGTYTITGTDISNCTASTVITLTDPPVLGIVSVTFTQPLCNGASNGTITVGAMGGTGTITYCLTPNVQPCNTTGNFTGISAGTYTVIATDANGCSNSTIVVVTQPTTVGIVSATFTPPLCYGNSNGTISATANGGTAPLTYTIAPLGPQTNTTGMFYGLNAQTYTVMVTDANNCSSATIVNMPQPILLAFTGATSTPPTCNGGNNGQISVLATGGVGIHVFTISPSGPQNNTTGNFTNLTAACYTVTVTDVNGCTSTTGVCLTQAAAQLQIQTSNFINPSCQGICNGSMSYSAINGLPPYTYTINPTTSFSGGVVNNLCVGNYTMTVADANACTHSTVFQMLSSNVNPPIYPNVSITPGSITASASGGTAPFQYSLNGSPFSTNNSFSLLCSGTYTLTVKDSYLGGCLKDTIVTVQATNTLPGVTFNSNIIQPTCPLSQNGSIQLIPVPSGTYTYTWNNSASGPTISNLNSGTFSVTITNAANQCIEMSIPLTALGNNCGDISGVVYYDSNTNCTQDVFEVGIPGTMITANPGNHITFTDALGNYSFLGLPYGTYTLTHANNINAFATACGNNPTVSISNAQASVTQDFGDTNTIFTDYQVWVINSGCFLIAAPTKVKHIVYKLNNPTLTSTGTVYAVFDSIQHFLSASPVPTAINGNVVSWNVTNINSYPMGIVVYFTLPTTFTTANTVPFSVGINNLQYPDTNILNNQINYTFPICNGYDPNDKAVAPKGLGPDGLITLDQSLFTYTVRFQNTGNAPAFNVVVVDTLSDNLDITTLNITEVSHNYQLEVVDNKILKWKFYNIMLPDSTTNFAGSIGHFIYQIRMKNGLQIGDQIKNKAYIYFDYNPPIITNETVNTIYQPSGVNNWNSGETVIYPNPTDDILYIDAEQAFTHYRLMDASLRIVKQARFTATRQQKVAMNELSPGIYFLQVGEGKLKKVVVR